MPAYTPPPVPLSFLFVRRRNLSRRVRLFQDWLTETLIAAKVIPTAA